MAQIKMVGISMKPNRFYMHIDCMDVCIRIIKSYQISANRFKVKAEWINLGYVGQPYALNEIQNIDIKDSRLWKDINGSIFRPRTQSGPPL